MAKEAAIHKTQIIQEIVNTIRSSLDPNDVKRLLIEIIGRSFNADRCFIRPSTLEGKLLPAEIEYLSSPDIKSMIGYRFNEETSKFFSLLHFTKQGAIIPDADVISEDSPENIAGKNFLREFNVKSNYGFPIFIDNNIYGIVVLQYTQHKVNLAKDDIELFQVITDQSSIAIKQADLYTKIKKQAEREALLRKINETIRKNLDIKEVKQTLVTEIGKVFNADRCFFRIFGIELDRFMPIDKYSEYLSNSQIKSLVGDTYLGAKYDLIEEYHKNGKELIILDTESHIKENNLESSDFARFIEKFKVKSGIEIPVLYYDQLLGVLVLHYTKEKKNLSDKELEFIREVAHQTGVTIYHSALYLKAQQTTKHERLLRKILSIIKVHSSLDDILAAICPDVSEIFNVQRVAICDLSTRYKLVSEYKTGYRIKSLDDITDNTSIKDYWKSMVNVNKPIFTISDIDQDNMPESVKQAYKQMGIKSLIAAIINLGKDKYGWLILSDYSGTRIWTKQEQHFMELIVQCISLAIRETVLYGQSQFLTNVSHEIKTPLATISGHIENLLKASSGQDNKSLKIVADNINRINNITNGLLYLSRIERDIQNKEIIFEGFEIQDILDSAVKICAEKAQSKSIKLELLCNPDIQAKINILLLQQAIVNLIENAIQYSPENSIIKTSTFQDKTNIIIRVQDYGYGIAKEHQTNIFERFYRVDKSRSRETGGSGLGLSIVKLIIEAHNGYLSLNSDIGKGSTFIIHLPKI